MSYRQISQGFALPTIVITSVVMFAILVTAISIVSSTRASLDSQFYENLATDAAESGAAHANSCLLDNNFVSTWGANSLRPNTSCAGGAACTSPATCFVVSTPQYRSTYAAGTATSTGNGIQIVSITGTVQLLRSNGQVWDTFTKTTNIRVGSQITASNLAIGYVSGGGMFFGVISGDGVMRTAGYNGYGQLGNGTAIDTLTPTKFDAPTIYPIVAGYANFLSIGFGMLAVDSEGNVFGSGYNVYGQLGNGTFDSTVTTPTKFILPAGVKAKFVSSLGHLLTFVIGDDNNIYASGSCVSGLLGSNYTIAGCSNRSMAVRVNLPTPDASNANTLPVAGSGVPADNIVSDRLNAYVRMQGGRVYGWGANDEGNLADGGTTDSSTPVKMGTYGDAGKPTATQLAFDGDELFILGSDGEVYATGGNTNGALAGAPSLIKHQGTYKCINNAYNSTSASPARIYDCISGNPPASELMTWQTDGSITTSPNSSTTLCLDNTGSISADNNPVQWYPCNGTGAQKWTYRDDGSIYNAASGKCLNDYNNESANDSPLGIWTCAASTYADQRWWVEKSLRLTHVPLPASAGAVAQIATDQWSVLFRTTNGQVWGAGGNDRGQLCNGTVGKQYNPMLTQVTMPSGKTPKYIYTTKSGTVGSEYANTYIVMTDGTVYGCGANTFGQLGFGSTSLSEGNLMKMNLPAGVVAKNVQSGYGTTVVLTEAGTVYTVGHNNNGQIGDGTTTDRYTPVFAQFINSQGAVSY